MENVTVKQKDISELIVPAQSDLSKWMSSVSNSTRDYFRDAAEDLLTLKNLSGSDPKIVEKLSYLDEVLYLLVPELREYEIINSNGIDHYENGKTYRIEIFTTKRSSSPKWPGCHGTYEDLRELAVDMFRDELKGQVFAIASLIKEYLAHHKQATRLARLGFSKNQLLEFQQLPIGYNNALASVYLPSVMIGAVD